MALRPHLAMSLPFREEVLAVCTVMKVVVMNCLPALFRKRCAKRQHGAICGKQILVVYGLIVMSGGPDALGKDSSQSVQKLPATARCAGKVCRESTPPDIPPDAGRGKLV